MQRKQPNYGVNLNKGRDGRTYAEVTGGDEVHKPKQKITVQAKDRIVLYPDHCMMRAVEFIERKLDVWGDVCSSAVLWAGQDISFDRLTWLKITGIPIQLRDNSFFNQIGSKFGRVIEESAFSWESVDNSDGFCGVLTTRGPKIDEEIEVLWGERSYTACISEVQHKSVEGYLDGLLSTQGSPVDQSSAAEAGLDDEVEDGEIRQEPDDGNPAVGRIEDETVPIEVSPEKSAEAQLSPREAQRVHGEKIQKRWESKGQRRRKSCIRIY
ncbi:hypothetical protein Hanom_Chr16g01489291 [Helianthus anomalus]